MKIDQSEKRGTKGRETKINRREKRAPEDLGDERDQGDRTAEGRGPGRATERGPEGPRGHD